MESWRLLHSDRWKHHTRSRCGAVTVHRGPALSQGRRHPSDARTCPALSGPADRICSPRESLGVSRINHILRVHVHTILQEKRAAEIFDEVGQRSLERLFPGFTEDRSEQATHSAGQSATGYKRARDISAPAHLGALKAAKPHIQAMIHDAVMAGLLPKHPLETRFAVEPPPPATKPSMTKTELRPSSTFKKRPRWQMRRGSKQLTDTMGSRSKPDSVPSSASQDEDSDDMDFSAPRRSRLSAPQLQAQLSRLFDRTRQKRLKNTLHSKGTWHEDR